MSVTIAAPTNSAPKEIGSVFDLFCDITTSNGLAREKAVAIAYRIQNDMIRNRRPMEYHDALLTLYEHAGWIVLGYPSWKALVKAVFPRTPETIRRNLEAAKVMRSLKNEIKRKQRAYWCNCNEQKQNVVGECQDCFARGFTV